MAIKTIITDKDQVPTDIPANMKLTKTISDSFCLFQENTGTVMGSNIAWDIYPCPHTYKESTMPCPREDKTAEEMKIDLETMKISTTKIVE